MELNLSSYRQTLFKTHPLLTDEWGGLCLDYGVVGGLAACQRSKSSIKIGLTSNQELYR